MSDPVRRIAFGAYDSWAGEIVSNLHGRYAPSFVDLSKTSPQEFDAMIPLQIHHYGMLANCREMQTIKFFHPSPEVVSLCDDKLRLAEFLIAEGFTDHVPPIRPPGAPYPYVWKKRKTHWGLDCRVVNGSHDEDDADLTDEDWFAQAFVYGDLEFATHILRVGGKIRYASTFAYSMAAPALIKGARHAPVHTRFSAGSPHLGLFSAILACIGYEGTACLDYKIVEGRPMIFEINPRVGGSLCSDITAYLDAYIGCLSQPSHRR